MQDLLRPVCWLLTVAYSARSMLKGSFPIMGHDYVEASNTLASQLLVCKRCGDRFESWN